MTIRTKLNLAFLMLTSVFLAVSSMSLATVTHSARQTREIMRLRELSLLTSDVSTGIYREIAAARTAYPPDLRDRNGWSMAVLDDIDVQIRQSRLDDERDQWTGVRSAVIDLTEALHAGSDPSLLRDTVKTAERHLRSLRNLYDVNQYDAMAEGADASFRAQVAIWVASLSTIILLILFLLVTRRWLVGPVSILKTSAEIIGRGDLDHRVPLAGSDELAQLARHVDAMADGLRGHQAALLEARELSAIGEISANVAHGLRNPLAAIQARVQVAAKRDGETDLLRDVAELARRMDQRISRLFQFSRMAPMNRQPTTFRLLADMTGERVRTAPGPTPELIIEDSTSENTWPIDREQFIEALAELVQNAFAHSDTNSTVTLRGECVNAHAMDEPMLRIQVIDRGQGMSTATQAKAFDLFFTSRPTGSGVGLALVKRIVDRHAGDVHICSTVGEGTTVTIDISNSPNA